MFCCTFHQPKQVIVRTCAVVRLVALKILSFILSLGIELKRTYFSFRYLGLNCFAWKRGDLARLSSMEGSKGKIKRCVQRNLRTDSRIFMHALERSEFQSLIFMSKELKQNKRFALEVVVNYPFALRFFSNTIRDSNEVIEAATRENYFAKIFASERLQGELSIFEEEVRSCFLEKREPQGRWMIHDRDIIAPYIQENFHKISEISHSLRGDSKFFLKLLKTVSLERISHLLENAYPEVLRDRAIIENLIRRLPR